MADSNESNATADSSLSSFLSIPSLPSNLPISVKLTDSNFLIWQQQIEATVWGYGLEGYLTGETPLPPALSSADSLTAEMLASRRQDQRLRAWLLSSLSESALIQVVGLKTTKDIWKALLTNYASQSLAKIMQIRSQLQHTKKENLGMQEYLNKMKSYCDFLGSADCAVTERDQILYILGGLSQEYNPIMVAISSRREPWTVQEVSALLLTFETRLKIDPAGSAGSVEGTQPSLNLAQQSGQRNGNAQHFSSHSNRGGRGRSGRGGRGGRNYNNSKVICQLCQKPGHGADKCWYRYEPNGSSSTFCGQQQQQYQPPQHSSAHLVQSRPNPMGSSPLVACPSEYSYDSSNTTAWYPDSGATNHVTNDLSNLTIGSEYTGGKKLALGDGHKMNIAHIGETHLLPDRGSLSSKKLLLKNLLHVPNITKNLISVSQFARDNSVFFEFHHFSRFVKYQQSKEIVLKGTLEDGL